MLATVSRSWPANSAGPARARIGYAASAAGDKWRDDIAAMAHAALLTDLADVSNGVLASARIWAPYRALAETLEFAAGMGLKATVCGTVFDPEGSIVPTTNGGDRPDPRTAITYALEFMSDTARRAVHAAVDLVPPCCARSRNSSLERLAYGGGAGPLHAYAVLAPLGVSPLRHVPCALDCSASVGIVNAFIARALALGFEDAVQAWGTLEHCQPSMTLRAGSMEVTLPGLRFTYPSTIAESRRVLPASGPKRWMLTPTMDAIAMPDPSFASEFARRSRFATVVWEQEPAIHRAQGKIVHLGCADGLLLELLRMAKPSAQTHCIAGSVASKALDVQAFEWEAELAALLAAGEKPALLLFDPMPLVTLSAASREVLRRALLGAADEVIAYATDAGLQRYGELTALASAAGIALVPGRRYRVSALLSTVQ